MYGLSPARSLGWRQAALMKIRLSRFLRPLMPRSPANSAPPRFDETGKPKPQVRSLARGDDIIAAASRVSAKSRVHGDAVLLTTLNALDAMNKKPELGALPWRKMHLIHAVYPAGADLLHVRSPGDAPIRGVQVGNGTYVRDSKRQLHIYTLVYVR